MEIFIPARNVELFYRVERNWKNYNYMKKPVLKIRQHKLKHNSLKKGKFRGLRNWKPCIYLSNYLSIYLIFYILHILSILYIYIYIMSYIIYIYICIFFEPQFLNSLKLYILLNISSFVIGAFETSLWNDNLYILKFNSLGKVSIMCKIWNFHPGLKLHLGLPKRSWNFNLVYRVYIFICNCNAIFVKKKLTVVTFAIKTRENNCDLLYQT